MGASKFERLTMRARSVLTLAQEEAIGLNHEQVGPEHILLGLLGERWGPAGRVLSGLGAQIEDVRRAVEEMVPKRAASEAAARKGTILSQAAKRAIEDAVDEADRRGHYYIATQQLLLGVISDERNGVARVLQEVGIHPERVRDAVEEQIRSEGAERSSREALEAPARSLLQSKRDISRQAMLQASLLTSLRRLSMADKSDVQAIAASQIELLTAYYNLVLDQARRSFAWALRAAAVGLAFFLASVTFILWRQLQSAAVISLASGALVEVIAGINFYLYSKTAAQMTDFQARLDTTQRYLLANSMCEGLEGDAKQRTRAALVRTVAEGCWPHCES